MAAQNSFAEMNEFVMDDGVAELLEQALRYIDHALPEAHMELVVPRVRNNAAVLSKDKQADEI